MKRLTRSFVVIWKQGTREEQKAIAFIVVKLIKADRSK
jgi:hypothetical protein